MALSKGVRKGDRFIHWLHDKMREHSMTYDDVSEFSRVDRKTFMRHCLGRVMPRFPYILAYCYAFNDGDDPEDIWALVQQDWDYPFEEVK